jgi:hypothetical protein
MPFATAKEHRDFFNDHQRIEFENLLTDEQCKQIQKAGRARGAGRDLWRNSAAIKKIVCSRDYAQIACELTGARELRLGYDQMVDIFPNESVNLLEISCIQGILCGLIICIQKPSDEEEEFSEFFPQQVGTGIFFSAETLIPFGDLVHAHKGSYFLIAYTAKDAVYVHQDNDPYLHQWKPLGYAFGDRLQDAFHPMLYH